MMSEPKSMHSEPMKAHIRIFRFGCPVAECISIAAASV
jgi:hypothetical protein